MKRIICIILYLSTFVAWAQTATVTLTSTKQTIRGFGGINHPVWAGDLTVSQRTTAFGNDVGQLGMSILRIWISDNKNDWPKEIATAKRAVELGAIVFATPWNPPAAMCETVTRNNRQEKRLKYDRYDEYAAHLVEFITYMKNNGVNLYAISFANEPDYGFDWTWYSADEVYNFTKNNVQTIKATGVKIITAESFSYSKKMYDQILNDSKTLANIDIIGCHIYGSDANTANTFFQYPLADQKAANKERWMTEHYTESANDADLWPMAHDVSYEIHRSLVEGQMNAYVWWYIRRKYGPMKEDGSISKRGYCYSQFSKFVRPGYVRVDATNNPTTDVYLSAFKKGDNVVVVAVNRSTSSKTITMSVPGTKVITWEKYVTSGSKSLAKEPDISAATGSFQITLDAQSTTSFVGTPPNVKPVVSITAPANNTVYVSPAVVNITATASDADGTISKVEFYNGTSKLSEDASSPYSFSWTNVAAGTYNITAIATDDKGAKTTSSVISILVSKPTDCAGIENGTAILDNCGRCVGGTTSKNACAGSGEAEDDACTYDGTVDNNNAGFKGTGFINVPNAIGSQVTFKINTVSAGSKLLSFRYASGGTSDRSATIYLNGSPLANSLSFPATGAFTTYKSVDLELVLNAGTNIVQLISTTADGLANIDQIGYVSSGISKADCNVITSVEGAHEVTSVSIYPNPSFTNFHISLNMPANIEIANSEGKVIESFGDALEIEFGNDLLPGIYFVKVENKVYKFVKY